MQVNRQSSNQNQNQNYPYINNIISNISHLNLNKIIYKKIAPNKTYQSKVEPKTYNSKNPIRGQTMNNSSKSLLENNRYNTASSIKEEPEKIKKISKNEVKTEQSPFQTLYKNRAVKTIIETSNQKRSTYYPNYNNNTHSSMRHSISYSISNQNNSLNNIQNSSFSPSNHKILTHNYSTNPERSNSKYKYSNIKPKAQNINNNSMRYSLQVPPLPINLFYSKNYTKINPYTKSQTKPESLTYKRKAFSPGIVGFQRKTINRGEPVKNVQITHIINSTIPSAFNIKEKLSTEFLNTEPLRLSQTERYNLKKSGKTSWTTSVQENIKPIVANLKGRTTFYQHARGIGMTNDTSGKLNPLYYKSEIRKLFPYVKRKMKEKVEYMTFRNETGRNTTYISGASNLNINNNYNTNNNTNNSYRNSINYVSSYNNYNTNNNNIIEIIKETETKADLGNRSQYRKIGNNRGYIINERKVYNPNYIYKKN